MAEAGESLSMPATSDRQRRLFGAILAYKKGKFKHPAKKLKKISRGITGGQAFDFAKSVKKRSV